MRLRAGHRKLAWALADDASLDDLVKRAAQIDREGRSTDIGAISTDEDDMRPGQDQSDLNGKIWQKLDESSRGQQQLASSVAEIKAQKPSLRQFPSNTSRDSTRQNVI